MGSRWLRNLLRTDESPGPFGSLPRDLTDSAETEVEFERLCARLFAPSPPEARAVALGRGRLGRLLISRVNGRDRWI